MRKRFSSILSILLLIGMPVASAAAAELSFQPDVPLTRAAFTKIIVEQMFPASALDTCFAKLSPSKYNLLFTDVPRDAAYGRELCLAMRSGLVRGYSDGSFRPDQRINFAESAKILSRAFNLLQASEMGQTDPWYRAPVAAMERMRAIPISIGSFADTVTEEELRDILARLANRELVLPSQTYSDLEKGMRKR